MNLSHKGQSMQCTIAPSTADVGCYGKDDLLALSVVFQLIYSSMTFQLSTPPILNSCSSHFKRNLLKYTTSQQTPPSLFVTLVLSSTNISPLQIRSVSCPDHAAVIFINFVVSVLTLILKLPPLLSLPSSMQNL